MRVAKYSTYRVVPSVSGDTDNKKVIIFMVAISFIIMALWLISKAKTTAKNNDSVPAPPFPLVQDDIYVPTYTHNVR